VVGSRWSVGSGSIQLFSIQYAGFSVQWLEFGAWNLVGSLWSVVGGR